jgi:hypothetical protein
LISSISPQFFQIGDDALARLEAIQPAILSGPLSLILASAVKMLSSGRLDGAGRPRSR